MEQLVRELTLAARSLRRAPAFAVTAILSLTAGVFVVAATFAITNAYLVRAMPYPAAKRLVRVTYAPLGEREPRGLATIDWAALSDVVEWADFSSRTRRQLVEGAQASDVLGLGIAPGSFEALGVRVAAGRLFTPDEYRAGAENVVLAAPALLRGRQFSEATPTYLNLTRPNSGDPPVPHRIVGVLPPGTRYARAYATGDIEFVLPQSTPATAYMLRLRPGVPIEFAERRLSDAIRQVSPGIPADWEGIRLGRLQEEYVSRIRPILVALTAAAALVLLIVAANVAVLVVLRALKREREVAVRVALGAGRWQIARLLGAEAVIICAAAVTLGLGLSAVGLALFGSTIESRLGLPVPGGTSALDVDATVMLVAATGALVVAVLLAFAPLALPMARRFEQSLRAGARAGSDGPGVRRARSLLVALQVAASLTLLFGGGLIARTVRNLVHTDFGYDAAELVRARIRFPERPFPDTASMSRYQQQLEATVLALTGSPVAFSTVFPFFEKQQQRIEVPGRAGEIRAAVNAVGSHYFDVVGMTLRSGRAFGAGDGVEAERVAIVSETLARLLWPGGEAIGQRIRTGADMNSGTEPTIWRTVVGVVSDVRETHRDADYKDVLLPAAQMGTRFASVLAKPGARTREWHESLRTIATAINPSVDVGPPAPLADGAHQELAAPRFLMSVLTGLAALAVGIALVGIYGVTAYTVEQRRREIAVRSALGAPERALVGLFVVEGARVVGIGVGAGVLGAIWLGRVLQNQVYGVAPSDAATLLGASTIVATCCLLAAWLPARRAASLDAATVLRAD